MPLNQPDPHAIEQQCQSPTIDDGIRPAYVYTCMHTQRDLAGSYQVSALKNLTMPPHKTNLKPSNWSPLQPMAAAKQNQIFMAALPRHLPEHVGSHATRVPSSQGLRSGTDVSKSKAELACQNLQQASNATQYDQVQPCFMISRMSRSKGLRSLFAKALWTAPSRPYTPRLNTLAGRAPVISPP